jgi:hypothetical protein
MKNYTYTARDADGAIRRGDLQAGDRVSAVRELAARGLVLLSITENSPLAKRTRLALDVRSPVGVGILAGLALAAFVCLYMTLKMSPPKKASNPVTKGVRSVEPKEPQPIANAATNRFASKTTESVSASPEKVLVTHTRGSAAANASDQSKKPVRGAQRRLAEAIEKGLPTEPLFKHETENMLALYIHPGDPIPPYPVPDNIEEEARKALAEDIAVTDADTQEQEQDKEMVAWLKDDLRKYLAGGGTAKEFFEQMQTRQEEEASLFLQARAILGEFNRAGNTDETMAAYKALNDELKSKGISPLPLPGNLRKPVK